MSTIPPGATGPWRPGTDASDTPPSPDDDDNPQLYLVIGPQIGAGFKIAVAYLQMVNRTKMWVIANDEGGYFYLRAVHWFAEIRGPE